jgi:lipopolysaccharide biosynthesis glycosyltransferase
MVSPSPYIIATAIDRAFVEPACVLLASIAANADVPETGLVIYGLGLTPHDRDCLAKSCGAMANKLSVVDLDFAANRLKKLPVTLTVPSVVAYARMLVPSILPYSTSRLLYLDSDIVVINSLRPLFETNLAGSIVAAVPDAISPSLDLSFRSDVLKLSNPRHYFNSGVLLIDAEAWRKEDLTEKAFSFVDSLPPGTRLFFPDQDVLNAVLADSWLPLDRKWNFFIQIDEGPLNLQRYRSEATVVHFASGEKPWVSGSTHPGRQFYLDHRKLTPFAKVPMDSRAKHRLNQFLRSPITTVKNLSLRLLRR